MPTSYEDSGPLFLRGAQVGSGMAETAVRNQRMRQQMQEDAELLPLKIQEAVLAVKGRESQLQGALSENLLKLNRINDVTAIKDWQIRYLSGDTPSEPPPLSTKEGIDGFGAWWADTQEGSNILEQRTTFKNRVAAAGKEEDLSTIYGLPFGPRGIPTAAQWQALKVAEAKQAERTQARATEKTVLLQEAMTSRAFGVADKNADSREEVARLRAQSVIDREEIRRDRLAAERLDKNQQRLYFSMMKSVDADAQLYTSDMKNAKKREIAAKQFGIFTEADANTPAYDPGAAPTGTNSTKMPVIPYNSRLKKLNP